MTTQDHASVTWRRDEVMSPLLAHPVSVIAAKDIPHFLGANRFQNLSIYLPETPETSQLIGTVADSLPGRDSQSALPRYHVHVHGGAWRDPQLTSKSIEPTVAHVFSAAHGEAPILAVASLNYTLSQFPTHPTLPYDAVEADHGDPAREARHPQHLTDVLHGLALLRSFGLSDASYVLSGHSAGASLAFQAILQSPRHYGLQGVPDAPRPAALIGLNGLYDFVGLVNGLDAAHEHLRDEYEMLLSNAFGADMSTWPAASPARFDLIEIAERVSEGKAPGLAVLDQSAEDQLVPMNQRERFQAALASVQGLRVVKGHRCTGKHAAPWEQGVMISESLQDVFMLLRP